MGSAGIRDRGLGSGLVFVLQGREKLTAGSIGLEWNGI